MDGEKIETIERLKCRVEDIEAHRDRNWFNMRPSKECEVADGRSRKQPCGVAEARAWRRVRRSERAREKFISDQINDVCRTATETLVCLPARPRILCRVVGLAYLFYDVSQAKTGAHLIQRVLVPLCCGFRPRILLILAKT